MAQVNKSEVVQEIVEGLRLDTAREQVPRTVSNVISPVFVCNPSKRFFEYYKVTSGTSQTNTVPDGKIWKIIFGATGLLTNATVGNRQYRFELQNSNGDVQLQVDAVDTQAASVTERYSYLAGDTVSETVAGKHIIPVPVEFILYPGSKLIVKDINTIAAGDQWYTRLMIEEWDLNPQS